MRSLIKKWQQWESCEIIFSRNNISVIRKYVVLVLQLHAYSNDYKFLKFKLFNYRTI